MSTIFCSPNYLKSTYFVPVIGGGDWDVDNWLDYLQDKYYINKALSTDCALASTRFDVDLSARRDVKAFVIPNSNVDNDGLIRVQAADTPAWSGVVVNGVNTLNATTLNVTAGAAGATITAGEIFRVAGNTQTYKVATGAVISASSNGSITLTRTGDSGTGLAVATVGAEAITCHSGDFIGDSKADTGWVDYRKVIYGLTDPWGSPTVWTGKETLENISTLDLPNPFIHIFDGIVLARYWRVEIDNTTNPDNFLSVDDCYISSSFSPSTGIGLGAVMGIVSNTTAEESAGGVEAFDIEKSGRYVDMTLPGLTLVESMTSLFDMQRRLDIHDDFFFIFETDDDVLMTRRSFPARFKELAGQQFVAYDWVDSKIRIQEKLG